VTSRSSPKGVVADTDDDGVSDAQEDFDGDNLTTAEESDAGTIPVRADSDQDRLRDDRELDLGTDPLDSDTDGDGLLDGEEVEMGTDPLSADSDGDGVPDDNETYTTTTTNETVNASVAVTGEGNVASDVEVTADTRPQFEAELVDNLTRSPTVSFETDREFENATISIQYDDTGLPEANETQQLALFRYNESLQMFVPLNSTVDAANDTVFAETPHFSSYAVLSTTAFQSAFGNEGLRSEAGVEENWAKTYDFTGEDAEEFWNGSGRVENGAVIVESKSVEERDSQINWEEYEIESLALSVVYQQVTPDSVYLIDRQVRPINDSDKGMQEQDRYMLYAINRSSGEIRWHKNVTNSFYFEGFEIDDSRLYLANSSSIQTLSNRNGSVVWRRDDLNIERGPIRIRIPDFGTDSPATELVNESIVLNTESGLTALHREDGQTAWEQNFEGSYYEPRGIVAQDVDYLYALSENWGFEPQEERCSPEVTTSEIETNEFHCSPDLTPELVRINSSTGTINGSVDIEEEVRAISNGIVISTNDKDGVVTGYDLSSGKKLWTRNYDSSRLGSSDITVTNETLVLLNRDGEYSNLSAFDLETGNPLWEQRDISSDPVILTSVEGYAFVGRPRSLRITNRSSGQLIAFNETTGTLVFNETVSDVSPSEYESVMDVPVFPTDSNSSGSSWGQTTEDPQRDGIIVTERSQGALFGFGIHQSGELETIRIAPESIEEPLPSGSNDFGETSATYEREITIDNRDQATIQFLLKTTVSRANGSATIELVGENGRTITVASAGDSTDDNNSLRTPGGFIRDQDGGGDAGTPQGRYVTVDADVSALTGQTVTVRLRTEGNASLRLRGIQLKYALPNRDTDDDGLIDRLERDGVDHGVTCSWEDGCGTGRTTSTSPYSTDTDGDGLGDWQEVGDFVSETFTVEMTPGDSDTGSRVIGDDNSTVRIFTVRYFKLQSNPTVVDSDGDGLNDRVEVTSNWAVNYTATPSATEAVIEARKNNNSGLRYFVNRTGSSDPMDPDTDRDDIGDSREVLLGTNPSDDDTDGDSIRDAEEFEQNQDPTLHDASSPNVEILGIDTTTYSTTNVRYRVTFRVTDDSGVDTVSVSRGRYGEEVEVDGDSSTGARTISFTDRSSEATETIEAYTLGPSVLVQTADVHGNSHARRYRGPNAIAQLATEFGPGNGGYAEKGRIEFIAIVSGLAYSIAKQSQKTYEGALELLTTTYDVVTNPKQTLVRAVETIRSLTLDVDISVEKIKRFIEAQRQSLVSAQRTQNPFDANPEAGFRSNNRTFATGWYSGYAVGIGLSMILGEVAITRAVTVLAQRSSKVATLVRWKRQTEEYLFGVASDQIGKVSALTTRATKRVGSSAARAVYKRLPASTQGKVIRRVESGDSELSDAVLSIASREDQSGELLEYVAKGDTGSVRTLEALRDAESPESIRTLLDLDTGTQRQLVREYTQGDLSRDELQDALDQLQRFPDNERSRIQTLLRQTGSDGTRLVAQAESETIQDLAPGGSVSLGRGADEDIAAFRRVISQSVDSTGPDAPASYAQLRETLDTLEQIQPGLQSSARRLIRQGREPAMEFIADTDASVLRQLLANNEYSVNDLGMVTRRYADLNEIEQSAFSQRLLEVDRERRDELLQFMTNKQLKRSWGTLVDFDLSDQALEFRRLYRSVRDSPEFTNPRQLARQLGGQLIQLNRKLSDKNKLQPGARIGFEDIERVVYPEQVLEDSSRVGYLLQTNKWADDVSLDGDGMHDFKHIVARHADSSSSDDYDWPVTPGIEADPNDADLFPASLSPEEIKDVIEITIKHGDFGENSGEFIYSGPKLDQYGIQNQVVVRWNSQSGEIQSAFVEDSDNVDQNIVLNIR